MKSFFSNFSRHIVLKVMIVVVAIIQLITPDILAQTNPAISFTTTTTGNFTFNLRSVENNTPIQVDWGNGNQVSYEIGIDSTDIISPFGLSETTVVSVYGTGINYVNISSRKLTSIDIGNSKDLVKLICNSNQLKELDVSKNTALTNLNCSYNQLNALNVSNNPLLSSLSCYSNSLSSLNVSKNTALLFLNCYSNQLVSLDVSNNSSIKYLECGSNKLTALNVNRNIAIEKLYCDYNYIESLEVVSNNALQYLNCSNNFMEFYSLPKIDARFKSYRYSPQGLSNRYFPPTDKIIDLSQHLTALDKEGIMQTTYFIWKSGDVILKEGTDYTILAPGKFAFSTLPTHLFYCEMTNPAFPDLKGKNAYKFGFLMNPVITLNSDSFKKFYFWMESNAINNLAVIDYGEGSFYSNDISFTIPDRNNALPIQIYGSAITTLSVPNANLKSLDIKNCSTLSELNCNGNILTMLDVSQNVELKNLYCANNQISAFNIKQNLKIDSLNCSGNKLLTLDINSNSFLKFLRCGYNQMNALDLSNNLMLTNLYCNANKLINLNVIKNQALQYFDCSSNKISLLDLSKNVDLLELKCDSNKLSSLDVNQNILLQDLWCNVNQITSLDVSKNTNLSTFYCGTNRLSALDVSKNSLLEIFGCFDNLLTTIDVSKNPLLSLLSLRTNQIAFLDISNNTELTFLSCRDNKLKELDVSKNTMLTELYCYGNGLTFANLPQPKTQYIKYNYAPQVALSIPKVLENDKIFDLSAQLNAYDIYNNQQTTTYTWKTNTNNNLQEGTDYSISESGKFTFITISSDSVYCEMKNVAFPDFKDTNIYKTTSTKITFANGLKDRGLSAVPQIYAFRHAIYIHFGDNPTNTLIEVYDLNGRLMASKLADDLLTSIPICLPGMYVVRVDEKYHKTVGKVFITASN